MESTIKSFVEDIFERETSRLAYYNDRSTITSRQNFKLLFSLVLPGELAQYAVSTKAVTKNQKLET